MITKSKLFRLHQAYKKHSYTLACRVRVGSGTPEALYSCACGLFAWDPKGKYQVTTSCLDRARYLAIDHAVLTYCNPAINKLWHAYKAEIVATGLITVTEIEEYLRTL